MGIRDMRGRKQRKNIEISVHKNEETEQNRERLGGEKKRENVMENYQYHSQREDHQFQQRKRDEERKGSSMRETNIL